MSSCYIFEERSCTHKDSGFMGLTHAMSAVAVFLILVALFPLQTLLVLGVTSVFAVFLASLNVIGGAMLPDLDNTTSTAENSLSYLGSLLSAIFRTTSAIIQTTIRAKRDDPDPNPHRGFYHTIPAALMIGALVYFACTINLFQVTIPGWKILQSGEFFAILVTWMNTHIVLSILAKGSMKKLKKKGGGLGEILAAFISLGIVVFLFSQMPAETSFRWIGVSVAAGMLIHTFGDCFTTAGSPILFPFKFKGKRWWTVRFLPIKAGGVIENVIFLPFFTLVSIASIVIIVLRLSGLS